MTPPGDQSLSPPLVETHDGFLVDLDGVVYLGDEAVPGAAPGIAALRSRGAQLAFVTNNASRTPAQVAEALTTLGVPAQPDEVVTAAQAAAAAIAEDSPGVAVLVVGGAGLHAAIKAAGLRVVAGADERPDVVAQGWGPQVDWSTLAEACVALRDGARWVVTNRDLTLPSPRGPLPGSGALVAALVAATGREPDLVTGKPEPGLLRTAATALGAARPLMIGDRLDTDILGAERAGMPSLLVLTGVSTPADLLAAPPGSRPTYVAAGLGALTAPYPSVSVDSSGATCGTTQVASDGTVRGSRVDSLDGLRAATALAWSGRLDPSRYDDVLRALGLE